MSIEDIIRSIVREEIARVLRPETVIAPTPIYNPPGSGLTTLEDTTPIVPRREET